MSGICNCNKIITCDKRSVIAIIILLLLLTFVWDAIVRESCSIIEYYNKRIPHADTFPRLNQLHYSMAIKKDHPDN